MRAATRFGVSTVTARPRSSVKVYPWDTEVLPDRGEEAAGPE